MTERLWKKSEIVGNIINCVDTVRVSKLEHTYISCRITDQEVHASVKIPSNVYGQKCISLITKIVNDKYFAIKSLYCPMAILKL